MPLLSENLTAQKYRDVLERIYGLICPWEALLLSEIAAPLRSFALVRCRGVQLASDIKDLGGDPSSLPTTQLPVLRTSAELLGAMYVIEGSRLGGQLIARGVTERLGPAAQDSVSYFSGFKSQTGSMWREFVEVLTNAVPDAETDHAIHGAKQMFQCFGHWIAAQPKSGRSQERDGHRMVS